MPAAWNSVVEEEGGWFFCGMYLYPTAPDTHTIQERSNMFRETYENMLSFIEKENVDAVFSNLGKF